jgi:hypothetical protein
MSKKEPSNALFFGHDSETPVFSAAEDALLSQDEINSLLTTLEDKSSKSERPTTLYTSNTL